MHEELVPGFADRVAERIEAIYQAYDIENSNVDSYLFVLTVEDNQGLCRISVGRPLSDRSEPRYEVTAVLRGHQFVQHRDEIEQAFSSRAFYAEHDFNIWELS